MIKYVVETSEDAVRFSLACGDIELYDYEYQAEEQKQPWHKIFKVIIEEA